MFILIGIYPAIKLIYFTSQIMSMVEYDRENEDDTLDDRVERTSS